MSTHSRPDVDEEAPAKLVSDDLIHDICRLTVCRRARTDVKKEDKARSKRLFGNILGTLQRFKKEDKSQRGSEAVGRVMTAAR